MQIRQSEPNQLFLPVLTIFGLLIFDKETMEANATEADPWSHDYVNNVNAPGFGAYCLDRWTKNEEISYTANPDYFAGAPDIDRVTVRRVPQSSNRVVVLQTGGAQLVTGLTSREFDSLRAQDGISVGAVTGNKNLFLHMHFDTPPFDNPLVRQEIAHAIPFDQIIANGYFGQATQWMGLVPSSCPGFRASARFSYDPDMARRLLAEAGYPGGAGLEAGLLQGSLGTSWVTGSSVMSEIGAYLPVTLELITLGFLCAFAVAVPVGMLSALRPGGRADKGVFVYSLFAGSQPEFWWGLLFVYVLFYQLGWAPPPLGRLSPITTPPDMITGFMLIDILMAGRPDTFIEAAHHLVLPVAVLTFVLSGPIIKMVRQNMVRALGSDFVLYANAAGLPCSVVARHALRAAMAPSMTLIGILYGFMLSDAVLVESVFSLGGIGQYAVRSVLAFDDPEIQGVVLVITATSLAIYLMLDILHALIDPRIAC